MPIGMIKAGAIEPRPREVRLFTKWVAQFMAKLLGELLFAMVSALIKGGADSLLQKVGA